MPRIKELPRSVKMLKIAGHAEQDKGEEYWMDKEMDTFKEGDADDDLLSHRSMNSYDWGNSSMMVRSKRIGVIGVLLKRLFLRGKMQTMTSFPAHV